MPHALMTDCHATKPNAIERENAAAQRSVPAARDVVFLLLNEVVLMDVAGLMDVFRSANTEAPGSFRLRFAAPRQSVLVAGGLTFSACEPLPEELARDAILVVPGVAGERQAIDPREPSTRRAVDWLREAAGARQLLCVSSGSVLAAYAGLLSGRECTTHPDHVAELRRADPSACVLENRIFVEDGAVFTGAGVSAGVDLALHVIERQLGARIVANVARSLIVYLRRAGTDTALSPWLMHRDHLHPAVHRVQEAVTRDPTARWTAAALADAACTSVRTLSRLFREHAGCSPLHYVQQVRLALARQLVMQSRLDLKSVAARTGFRSAQHLRRVWSRWEQRPPSAFRNQALVRPSLQTGRAASARRSAALVGSGAGARL